MPASHRCHVRRGEEKIIPAGAWRVRRRRTSLSPFAGSRRAPPAAAAPAARRAAHGFKLRSAHPGWAFPDFDPLDGGTGADIFFLLEKPGPMASASGFISRDNDDPSADATFRFMAEAGLPRGRTVTWNVIPGWNGTRKVTPAELRAGVDALTGLLPLLPKLRTIILVGKKAQRAAPLLEPLGLWIFASPHPSPLVRASQPEAWRAIPSIWARARAA
jgi:hypothetical protein